MLRIDTRNSRIQGLYLKGVRMKEVVIRYCRVWLHNHMYAVRVAAFMHQASEIETRLDSKGKIGELTVWVGDSLVVKKGLFKFPDKKDVLAAGQQEL